MRHHRYFPALLLILAAAPLTLAAQTGTRVLPDTLKKFIAQDTTRTFVLKDREETQIALLGGSTYAAVLDGREITLMVKPLSGNLRDPMVVDVSLPGSTEMVSRFNVRADDTGIYLFSLTGMLPGRDMVMRLTGPVPPKAVPVKKAGGIR